MKEDIMSVIDEELDQINPNLDELYNEDIINSLNNIRYDKNQYKKELLKVLDNLKDMGVEIEYNENMSIEELEKIVEKIKA